VRLQRQSDGQLITIDPALVLGTGGEARVYAIPQEPSLVAKVYHEPTGDRARKLMAMLANPPDDPLAVREHVAIAWPVQTASKFPLRWWIIEGSRHFYKPKTSCLIFHVERCALRARA
jgi:hypothetical protein